MTNKYLCNIMIIFADFMTNPDKVNRIRKSDQVAALFVWPKLMLLEVIISNK